MTAAEPLEIEVQPPLPAAGGQPPLRSPSRLRATWTALALALAAVPPLLYVWLISSTDENVLSNDQILWVPIVDRMASGTYDYGNLFKDAFQSGVHELAIPILFTQAMARWFEWNVSLILYVFLAVAALKVALLQRLIAGDSRHPLSIALWPALSALVFAPAHVNVFTFSFSSTHIGLAELGFVLGLFSILRLGPWAGALGACLGGLLASWSWGSGLAVWPLFFAAISLRPGPRAPRLLAVGLAAAVAALPYFLYFKLGAGPHKLPSHTALGLLRAVVEAVGYPWCDVWSNHRRALGGGAVGLTLLAAGVASLWPHRRSPALWLPFACLLGYGAALIGLTVLLRGTNAPWYTTSFAYVWLALVAMAHTVLTTPREPRWARAVGAAVPLALGLLVATGGAYERKVFYLHSKGPAAASCLRAWRTAPTTCETILFQWAPGNPDYVAKLAEPLERHRWGVFGKSQRWSMQGDAFIGRVETDAPEATPVQWVPDHGVGARKVTDYRRLDAKVPAGSTVSWRVDLPRSVSRAALRTAVAFSGDASGATIAAGGAPLRFLPGPSGRWEPASIPLHPGLLTITFTALGAKGSGYATFRFPVIELEVGPEWAPQPAERRLRSAEDFVFDLADPRQWRTQAMTAVDSWSNGRWWVSEDPQLVYAEPLDLRLGDFRWLMITAAASPKAAPRLLQVFYRTAADPRFREGHSFKLPLYLGAARTYEFDLNALGLPPDTRLRGLRIDPLDRAPAGERSWVQLSDLRLLRRERPPELLPGSSDDLVFTLRNRAAWHASAGITPVSWWDTGRFWLGFDPYLVFRQPFDAPLAEHSAISVTAALSPSAVNRTLTIYYITRGAPRWSDRQTVKIPIAEGPERTYQVDLASLGLPAGERLTGIRVDPVEEVPPGPSVWAQLSDLRLLRKLRPAPAGGDLVFDLRDRPAWHASEGLTPVSSWDTGRFWVRFDPYLVLKEPLDVALADYAAISVTAQVSEGAPNRTLTIYYTTQSDPRWSERQLAKVALAEGPARTYRVELATLGLPPGERLTGIRFDPVEEAGAEPKVWVQLSDLRLVRRQ